MPEKFDKQIHIFHPPDSKIEKPKSPEGEFGGHTIVGVFGPSGIGKDTILKAMDLERSTFSIGSYLREQLLDQNKESFLKFLEDKGLEHIEEDGATYKGQALLNLIEDRLGKGPIPQVVADAILKEYLKKKEEGVTYLSGGPHSKKDLETFEQSYPGAKFAFVYFSPAGDAEKWRREMGKRYSGSERSDYNPGAVQEKEDHWRKVTSELLKYIHHQKYPLIYIEVKPDDKTEDIKSKLQPKLDKLIGQIIQEEHPNS